MPVGTINTSIMLYNNETAVEETLLNYYSGRFLGSPDTYNFLSLCCTIDGPWGSTADSWDTMP